MADGQESNHLCSIRSPGKAICPCRHCEVLGKDIGRETLDDVIQLARVCPHLSATIDRLKNIAKEELPVSRFVRRYYYYEFFFFQMKFAFCSLHVKQTTVGPSKFKFVIWLFLLSGLCSREESDST
jgi:hypothetical protein